MPWGLWAHAPRGSTQGVAMRGEGVGTSAS